MSEVLLLECARCGSREVVESGDVRDGKPIRDWFIDGGRLCGPCRARMVPLPNPVAPITGQVGRAHPHTSVRAAELVAPRAGSQRAGLLDALYEAGGAGLTAFEASALIAKSPNQTATRLGELREQGWVEYKLGESGKPVERATTPGNTGLVQVLTGPGRDRWVPEP